MNTANDDPLIGKSLGPYRIEARLGAGGMGEVYRALHVVLARPVAIKTLRPEIAADRSSVQRFFAEARAANLIRHENIVEYTDLVSEPDGRAYMVMELLEGRTLSQAIRDHGQLDPRQTVRIAAQIADALDAAHAKGIIHRDLKPDNVFLIRRMGMDDYVKVLDFGIARLRPDLGAVEATRTGAIMGTPAYMSPEQVMGEKVTAAADIYALGVMLFKMLTGRLPFDGPTVPVLMMAHVSTQPPAVETLSPSVPQGLSALVARALAKRPGDRPASMAGMRAAMLEAVGMTAAEMPGSGPGTRTMVGQPAPRAQETVPATPGARAAGQREAAPVPDRAADPADAQTRNLLHGGARPGISPDISPGIAIGEDASQVEVQTQDPAGAAARAGAAAGTGRSHGGAVRAATPLDGTRRGALAGRRPLLAGAGAALAIGLVAGLFFGLRDAPDPAPEPAPEPSIGDRPLVADPAGTEPDEAHALLRQRLDQATRDHGDPVVPADCRTRDPDLLARLVQAATLLEGGTPGGARDRDADAIRALGDRDPDQEPEYWHWLAKARLYAGAGDARALDAARRAVTLCDRHAGAYSLAGTALFWQGQDIEAETHYRKALELAPEFLHARFNLGLVLVQQGRVGEGLDTLGAVIERDPAFTDAFLVRGQVHLMTNQPDRAVSDLELVTRRQPDSAKAFWFLGQAYQRLERPDDAHRALCRSRDLGHPQAAEMCPE